ncbi:MAG: DUF4190 domain-containing protein [Planctomycetota bacterium]|nr:DUF4190 domain-containing protein [Planctomycetota bacterium]
MTGLAKRLKANKIIEGSPCGWCAEPVTFGEDVALCHSCRRPHHAACWDRRLGCSVDGCLQQAAPEPPPEAPRPRAALLYTENAPGAVPALVVGLCGFLMLACAPVFGTLAIVMGIRALKRIERHERYVGAGMAMAGAILGVVQWLIFFLLLVLGLTGEIA